MAARVESPVSREALGGDRVPSSGPIATLQDRPRVVVLRALPGLGDLLCAIPALRALRRGRPDAIVSLIGLAETESLAHRFHTYVDEFIPFPGFPGLKDREPDVLAFPGFLERVQARRFDMAIQLHGSGWLTNSIVALFGAAVTAGVFAPGQPIPDGAFISDPDDRSEIRRWLALTRMLGCPSDDESLELPLEPLSAGGLDRLLANVPDGPDRPIVCIHPGGSDPSRRWAPARFATVADVLAAAGAAIVLTGSAGERPLTREVAMTMRAPSLDLAGRTDIDALGALLGRAALLVANDTGVSHVAAALGTRSVIVFSHDELRRWAPHDAERHRAVRAGSGRDTVAALALEQLERGRIADAA
jgi:ADP-heptose:LPS heptosyltransferase